MGFKPETSHHEAGPGQNEIDFRFSDALSAADNLLAFRAAVKAIAGKHGLYASFLPKPLPNRSGSGMHVNFSLVRDGKNIIHAADGLHDPMSEQFVEGVLRHAAEMAAFLNPLPNSYKRLGQFEAPRGIGWAKNGSGPHIIHVPPALGEQARVELRSPDPCCNPYLAFTLLLEAGLSGLEAGYPLRAQAGAEMEPGEGLLPETLSAAIDAAERSPLIAKVFPDTLRETYFGRKRQEAEAYLAGDAAAYDFATCFPCY